MTLGLAGSLLIVAYFLYGAHSSPSGLAVGAIPPTAEEMFAKIWEKYSLGSGTMHLSQLNDLLHDTDQEQGEQVVDEDWWKSLCKGKGVDPSKGLSKFDLLSFYFENPGSSITRDFIRIFFEGVPPAKTQGKNLLRKPASQMEEQEMFDEIWAKYSEYGWINLQQLNALLHDTDHERGEQVVDEAWWRTLCTDSGADPSKGLAKFDLLNFYFESPGSSIKRDFIRSFFEGAPLAKTQGNDLLQKLAPQMAEKEMFDEIWAKYSEHRLMTLRQLNALLQDTDQERGEQVVDEAWWRTLCTGRGADPSKGLAKVDLLNLYFESPGSSIKRDFIRIFFEGAPPSNKQIKNLPQKLALQKEEKDMFDEIWAKYSEHQLMNLHQLNELLHDTDQEQGEQVVDEDWWSSLCKEKGVDPSKGLSKFDLLSYYFENPGSSIKRDFIRIFVEGAPAATTQGENLLRKAAPEKEEKEMFDEIWAKYSEHQLMNLRQLNHLLHDTDQEQGEQVVDEEWWTSLCKEKGVDPSKGLSKVDLRSYYFENPGSSIKRDFIRIFIEGASPVRSQGKNWPFKPAPQMDEKEMFDEIWVKYSEHQLINLQQLNGLLRDTDQERGEQVVDDAWWRALCMDTGADPSKGITKDILLRFYFENPGSSIQRDFVRIFFEGAPVKAQGKNLLQKPAPQMEETEMFEKIWAKYSDHQLMNLQQLNELLHDTDQEQGEQVVDEAWWETLCMDRGADPSKGITKQILLRFYFEMPPSSIKRDYLGIFVDGAPPQTTQGRDMEHLLRGHSSQEQLELELELEQGEEQEQEQKQEQEEATLGFAAHISVGAFVLGSFMVLITEIVSKTLHRKS